MKQKLVITPSLPGPETVTINAGIGHCQETNKVYHDYAAGFSYRYAEFTPVAAPATPQANNFVGGYVRYGLRIKLTPGFSAGPFAIWQFYPSKTEKDYPSNPSSFSVGLSLSPSM